MRHIPLALALVLVSSLAFAGPPTRRVCTHGSTRCFAHVRADAAAAGFTPQDLWAAYSIDPNIKTTPTVAIVDAYGYPDLEADLATYRAQFGLPACTTASGCLAILNEKGQKSPLPGSSPSGDDWTVETALDVDMISAACPLCKIVVVQSDNEQSLFAAQLAAAAANPTVISDSWGGAEQGNEASYESYFDHPGIAQFASSGDSGWDDGGMGPVYPSTSAHVIAVGGTSLYKDGSARGFSEAAWTGAGSSCSGSIAKPSYQGNTSCSRKATADISAVADPATGMYVYNSAQGGWLVVGGTSAASPLVASMFAASGLGSVTAAQIAQSATSVLHDVTQGSNGSCGTILCNAGSGWDGPTGYGTPNAAALAGGMSGGGGGGTLAVAITSPADGATVPEMFQITATSTGASVVGAFVDGVEIGQTATGPYAFTAPHMGPGPHVVTVVAEDAAGDQSQAMVQVVVTEPPPSADTGDASQAAGCAAGGGTPGLAIVLLLTLAARRTPRAR